MQSVLDHILLPLARLCIARGVRFTDAAQRLRHAFLRAAMAEAGPAATDSRISVMTGLQRRDIAALKAGEGAAPALPPNPLSRIVAAWQADPALAGQPLPRRGEGPSFEALAWQVRKDLHPRTLLDQLVAAGTVRVDDADRVHLVQTAYQPLPGSDDQLAYLADNVGDHLETAVDNVTGAARRLERAVHYDGLDPAAVAELDAMWRASQQAAMTALNARASQLQASRPGRRRFRAGAYFHEGDMT